MTAKKLNQAKENAFVVAVYNAGVKELMELNEKSPVKGKRLRSCSAYVFETEGFYILRSYGTYVAVIRKYDDIMVDALRLVYGYTATSAQHIAKFAHDYGAGTWGVTERYTWREYK